MAFGSGFGLHPVKPGHQAIASQRRWPGLARLLGLKPDQAHHYSEARVLELRFMRVKRTALRSVDIYSGKRQCLWKSVTLTVSPSAVFAKLCNMGASHHRAITAIAFPARNMLRENTDVCPASTSLVGHTYRPLRAQRFWRSLYTLLEGCSCQSVRHVCSPNFDTCLFRIVSNAHPIPSPRCGGPPIPPERNSLPSFTSAGASCHSALGPGRLRLVGE